MLFCLPRYWILFCLQLWVAGAFAAGPGDPTLPGKPTIKIIGDPILQTDSGDCVIPFIRAGKLIIVQGKVDTTLGNFVLDTGAPGLVLNSTYFRDYPLDESTPDERRAITKTTDQVQRTMAEKFDLGAFHYFRVSADLLSLGHLENLRGIKILGLLGVALFKECEMIIDPVNQVIRLHHISRKTSKTYLNPLLKDSSQYVVFPFDLKENRILVKTKLDGREVKFVLDCAAETNLIDSRLPQKLLDSISIIGRVILNGSDIAKKEALSGTMNGLSIGSLSIHQLPVVITSLANTCFDGTDCIGGVLGDDFLSRYQIGFNFVTCKMYIWR